MDRAVLNESLLDEASRFPNIRFFFSHKVQSVDFHARTTVVRDLKGNKDVQVNFDFCIGADGSYSVVRRQLMRVVRFVPLCRFFLAAIVLNYCSPQISWTTSMDYHQEYIPHEYIELKMPSGRDQDGNPSFLLDPNYLHIWPRHSFMLIALPNKVLYLSPVLLPSLMNLASNVNLQDKTFTSTLFAPKAEFDRMASPEMTLTWFKSYFSDALSIIGEETLLKDFERNPRSPLISIKVRFDLSLRRVH
jgi:kynurenine 3-monooxygenase